MIKKLILIMVMIFGSLIPFTVKAYNEQIEPQLDFFYGLEFDSFIGTPLEDNYYRALDYKDEHCASYDSYFISNGGFGSYNPDRIVGLVCFNQSDNTINPRVYAGHSYGDYVLDSEIYKSSVGALEAEFYGDSGFNTDTSFNTNIGWRFGYGNYTLFQNYIHSYYEGNFDFELIGAINNPNQGNPWYMFNTINDGMVYYNVGDKIFTSAGFFYDPNSNTSEWNYKAGFNSNADDLKSQIIMNIGITPHNTEPFNFKIDLLPNDSENPVIPTLDNITIMSKEKGNFEVYKIYNGTDFIVTYDTINEFGVTSIIGSVDIVDGYNLDLQANDYQVFFNFKNFDNCNYQIYDDLPPLEDEETFRTYWVNYSSPSHQFIGYTRHIWPNNKDTAILTTTNSSLTDFKAYINMNSLINPLVDLKAYSYNYLTKSLLNILSANTYDLDPYYSYFDFTLDYENNRVGMFQRKISDEYTIVYIPNDVNVIFINRSDSSTIIPTPNGDIDINNPPTYDTLNPDNSNISLRFPIIQGFVNDLIYVRDFVDELYTYFYDKLPFGLQMLHDTVLVIFMLIIFLKVGVK